MKKVILAISTIFILCSSFAGSTRLSGDYPTQIPHHECSGCPCIHCGGGAACPL